MKWTEKLPSILINEIISDSNGNFGINEGESNSGCPNNEEHTSMKLNKNFFTLFLFNEKSFRSI